ncbi:MAG TPA: hypothetical protein VFG55_07985, partial [Rhodanobacteraceae bacterium]|nr:hypothetical protein [Rhodanobacteraceae bacterium]
LDPASIEVDAAGAIVVAADPESVHGVPLAEVWKLAPDGTRLWTSVLPNPGGGFSSLEVDGFALAPDGDALVALSSPLADFRVVRLAGSDGSVRWDTSGDVEMNPTGLALAPNGRVLVGGFAFDDSGGHVGARIAEFTASGAPCRIDEDLGLFNQPAISASDAGWTVVGVGESPTTAGDDLIAYRYDADGACTGFGDADLVFADGFDP